MKAQGLPLNTIVLGALAVLVLVLLAAAFVPGVGGFFATLFGLTPTDPVTICNNYCNQLNYQYTTDTSLQAALPNHPFCSDQDTDTAGIQDCGTYVQCTPKLSDGTDATTLTSAMC